MCDNVFVENGGTLTLFRMGLFGLLTDVEVEKKDPLPKICHIYPIMMEPDTVIHYLHQIQKIYNSRDILYDFCWHQQFFTGSK